MIIIEEEKLLEKLLNSVWIINNLELQDTIKLCTNYLYLIGILDTK